MDETEREAFLDSCCCGDDALRAEVESLLASHAESSEPARQAMLGVELGALVGSAQDHPQRIGAFEILGRLGEGSMGTVYRARQHAPDRVVALKLLRHGPVSKEAVQRFVLEANVLGRLQHPSIARIYEAGSIDGPQGSQPWFAMEWVEGRTLDRYVRERSLDLRARLRLMVQICSGVQHAHEKGVIHRDLKPANILVVDDETGTASPRIVDFGIARVTDGDHLTNALTTREGEIVGTLPYMSPEQVGGDPRDLDTRSDVYALGVLFYELLAGRLPLDLAGVSLIEASRIIREEEPPRLGTLKRSLRGDLETIAAKALEKDRSRRYESAAALADDLQRHLRDEPVAARPASTAYQLRKLARRHRAWVVGASVASVLLFAAALGTGSGLLRAQREAHRTESVYDFLADILTTVHPDAGGADTRLLDVADRAADEVSSRFADDPELEARIRDLLGDMYLSQAMDDRAELQFSAAIEQLSGEDAVPGRRVLEMRTKRLGALHRLDRFRDVESEIDGLMPLVRDEFGAEHEHTLTMRCIEARLISRRGRWQEAGEELRRVLADCQRSLGPDHLVTASVTTNLIQTLRALARRLPPHEGRPHLEEAIALNEAQIARHIELYGESSVRVLGPKLLLCELLTGTQDWERMDRIVEEVLESAAQRLDEHHALRNEAGRYRALALAGLGRPQAALAWIEKVVSSRRASHGPKHPLLLELLNFGAQVAIRAGQLEIAEKWARESADALASFPAPMHAAETPRALLAVALFRRGRIAEAGPILEELLDSRPYLDDPEWILLTTTGASLRAHQERWDEAAELLGNAARALEALHSFPSWLDELVTQTRTQLAESRAETTGAGE